MKKNVYEHEFIDAFENIRPDNFSNAGLIKLYEYLTDLEEDIGEEPHPAGGQARPAYGAGVPSGGRVPLLPTARPAMRDAPEVVRSGRMRGSGVRRRLPSGRDARELARLEAAPTDSRLGG